jgi:hypothetical protein
MAGLLAIALPILFHLIRRVPQRRQPFSSLMFLAVSPPRLTRRSRLSNILLLILRAAALALLAFAFARPFLRQGADLNVNEAKGRRIAVLVDTSASMRRGDLWSQAKQQVEKVLREAGPGDELGLFFFDRDVRTGVTFGEWNEQDPAQRAALLRARVDGAGPTWDATRLGEALATVAGLLAESEGAKGAPAAVGRQVVLISDVQQGAHAEALQGHAWPENVLLDVRPVAVKQAANASLQSVSDSGADESPDARMRVRVTNQADSTREQFTLAWANERGAIPGGEAGKVYVPPGGSQIVRVAWPKAEWRADRLVLGGDDCEFDNTLYVVPPRRESARVVFIGDDAADDVRGLLYYLTNAVGETAHRTVEVLARHGADTFGAAELSGTRLVVVGGTVRDERVDVLRRFAEAGGDVLWVLKDGTAAPALRRMTGADDLQVAEAAGGDYALVSRVASDHPLFAPFADARFGDFTKIHFWKHRKVTPPSPPGARVLAWFDNGDPFLLEREVGRGRVWVATSGWHPADSQLALSTKFVPLVNGMVKRRDGAGVEAQYGVHEAIPLPAVTSVGQGTRSVRGPDGKRAEIPPGATTFDGTEAPGLYRLELNGEEIPVAVNVAGDESRTVPMGVEELEQWGARLGSKPAPDEFVARQRQLQIVELENRQKLWRWLIVGVLGLLAAETLLAGRLARRAPEPQVVA